MDYSVYALSVLVWAGQSWNLALCPGVLNFAALSRTPARLHKWRCGSLYISMFSRCGSTYSAESGYGSPKKWAWSVKKFARASILFSTLSRSLL